VPVIDVFSGKVKQRRSFRLELKVEDVVELTQFALGLVVDRGSEVALVESRTGPLSPLDACVTMCQLHQDWLLKAGAKFAENIRVDTSGNYLCEVSPLVSYDGEGLLRSYPEILQLPLVLPSRFEREAKIPGAPLMQSVHIAPGAPTAGGDEWTKQADVQMPILPASAGQVPKQDLTDSEAMHHSKATSELIGRASSRQGLEASPGERLEVDPDEELHFREAAICAHEALDMLMKIEAGEFKDIAVQKMTRLRGLDDKVEGEEKEKDQEDEEEEDELGSDNSDIETRIEKIERRRRSISITCPRRTSRRWRRSRLSALRRSKPCKAGARGAAPLCFRPNNI